MLETALKLLSIIEENGFEAYIVGGFVRDYVLGIESNDIDICTNATPKDINNIFHESYLSNKEYGSVTLIYGNIRFEITTYRKEYNYIDNRKPEQVEFINDLVEDLKRRDFSINTLCMNKEGEIIDALNGRKDIDRGIIYTVGNSYNKFSDDAFRILRAIRFATQLNFKLSDDIKASIMQTKHYLKNISYDRKREELDKIFTNTNVMYGVSLLKELDLIDSLELYGLEDIIVFDDLLGVWAQINYPDDSYRFTSNESELIDKIREVLVLDNFDRKVLYNYGLYVNSVSASIKGLDKKELNALYNSLPIKSIKDISLNGKDISEYLNKEPGKYIKEILTELEKLILDGVLTNSKDVLRKYVIENYSVL